MQKAAVIFIASFSLFIGALLLRSIISNQTILASPIQDQAIISPQLNGTQTTHIEPETSLLSFVNADLNATQLADFNPSVQITTISPAVVEATPSPAPTPVEIVSTPKPSPTLAPVSLSPKPNIPAPSPSATSAQILTTTPLGSLNGDKIFDLVNDYRVSKNLPALQKDERSCRLAASRAPEIMGEVRSGTMHKGLAERKLPYWDNENIAYYDTEQETVKWWVSDTIHRRQIEGNFKYSCVACYHNACAEEFTNFSPK